MRLHIQGGLRVLLEPIAAVYFENVSGSTNEQHGQNSEPVDSDVFS